MAEPESDITQVVIDLLNTAWNTTNCPKPVIEVIYDVKRADLANKDLVLVYDLLLHRKKGDVQWQSRDWNGNVTIDIRTANSRARLIKLEKEVDRILMLYRKDPGNEWDIIQGTDSQNMSHRYIGIFRKIIEVTLVARKRLIE